MDEFFENAAAMFVAFKLIKAGTGRCQQDNFTRMRCSRSGAHGLVQRFTGVYRDHAAQLRLNLVGGRTDRVHRPHMGSQQRSKLAVVGVLVFTAEYEVNAGGEGRNGFSRGVDIGSLGVVIKLDTVDRRDVFEAMLDGPEILDNLTNNVNRSSRQPRCAYGGQHVFNIVLALERNSGQRKDGLNALVLTRSINDLSTFDRSEEHTSELQSLRHLVCRLLLE